MVFSSPMEAAIGKGLAPRFKRQLQRVAIKRETGYPPLIHRWQLPAARLKHYWIPDTAVAGAAPKDFLYLYEGGAGRKGNPDSWPAYIAKVGHKCYPAESVTEHLMTRLAQAFGVRVADSRLLICDGQLRFLSRYFLRRDESLYHGAEILADYLQDKAFVGHVGEQRLESDMFTFQVVCMALRAVFSEHAERICDDLVRMIGFDALVGNQDRHFYNWGVIVHTRASRAPRFSPVYDTARGLFWNEREADLAKYRTAGALDAYVNRAKPIMGCDPDGSVTHFQLISRIAEGSTHFAGILAEIASTERLAVGLRSLDTEFSELLSSCRRELMKRCLEQRLSRYAESLGITI
jgi:hypothetical protein